MATGMDLIISAVCNATICGPLHDISNPMFVSKDMSQTWLKIKNIEKRMTMNLLAKELNGKHLKVATYQNYPLSSARPNRHKNGKLVGNGVSFFVLNILKKKFNFTYDIVLPQKNFVMGGAEPEDSLIGLVSSRQVDMAAAFVANILEFRKLVTYSITMDEETWVMLMKRPRESAVGEGLLAPFTTHVWFLILATVVFFGPCITILSRVRAKLIPEEVPIPVHRSIWFVYGAFIKQATTLSPKANSTRVLFTTWWLFILLLSAFYTANLTAFLTLSEFTLEIQRPRDLYEKNSAWVANEGSAVQFVVTSPTNSMYYLNKMVKSGRADFFSFPRFMDFFKLVDKGTVLIRSSDVAIDGMYRDYVMKTRQGVPEAKRCAYVIAPHPFMNAQRGFIYPKNSTLSGLFDSVIGVIIQSGMVDRYKTLRFPDTTICPLDLQSKERKLQNTDLFMTYTITVSGLCIAIAAFIGEILIKRLERIYLEKLERSDQRNRKVKFRKYRTEHYFDDKDCPPPYEAIYGKASEVKLPKNNYKKIVNGREYLVVNKGDGTRLVPVRTPSALLYKLEKIN